jgi:hypothetical protein
MGDVSKLSMETPLPSYSFVLLFLKQLTLHFYFLKKKILKTDLELEFLNHL